MIFTVYDVLKDYFLIIVDKVNKYEKVIELDKEWIEKDPNNTLLKWEEDLIEDQKKLEEYKEKKEKLKNCLKNNMEKLKKMEIK